MSLGVAALSLLLMAQAQAQAPAPAPVTGSTRLPIQMRSDSAIRIEVQKSLPASWAYAPLRITIDNGSDRDREWSFAFTATDNMGRGHRESRFELRAPALTRVTREIVVPLGGDILEPSTSTMRVTGYAVENPSFDYALSAYGVDQAPLAMGVSTSVTADAGAASLGTLVDPTLLPADWRGLSGLRALVLSDGDWRDADASVRGAVLAWVARGGHLIEVAPGEKVTTRSGLGVITKTSTYRETLGAVPAGAPDAAGRDYVAWASRSVPRLTTNVSWLTGFLIGYAILIGPVNLFVFAPTGKRARLFWTMPALSVAASVALALVILIEDGVGGTGHRFSLVYSMPDTNREVVVQEQVVRTGVLVRTSFEVDEPVTIYDTPTNHRTVTKRLSSRGAFYSGDWFRSRRVHAQRLEAVRPARARIEQLTDDETPASAPEIHSALAGRLTALFYRDHDGAMWTATGVAPGQRVTLAPASEETFETWWRHTLAGAGPRVQKHVTDMYWERDLFIGIAASGGRGVAIETLDGIGWTTDTVVYAGRLAR